MGTWKFEVELFLPMVQTSEGENGGFPSKLTFQSIFSVEKEPLKFNNMNVRLRPWPESLESKAPINTFPHKYESACLEIHVVAMNEEDSLCLVQKSLETLLERFTFIIQLPLGTGILIQRNPDSSEKHYSNCQILVQPNKYPVRHGLELGENPHWFNLSDCGNFEDEKINRALHWYAKAISESDSVDRFIYLWIALEILCNREGVKVSKPYVAPCNCLIENCPNCGKSTEKPVNGDSIKQFLIESIGIDSKVAGKMWKLRQLVHGQKISKKIEQETAQLTQTLYNSVSDALKQALNLSLTDRPLPPRNPMFGGGFFVRNVSQKK